MNTIELTSHESEFLEAYITAIYFTEDDATEDLDPDYRRNCMIDCLAFYQRIACYLKEDQIEQAGHDFWLTRNGHGTGFWDRSEIYGASYAVMFSKVAEFYGESNPEYAL